MASRDPIHRHSLVKHLFVLAGYTLLSLLLTWPLVTRLTTHVPGDGIDDPALVWNLWWIQERLVNQLNLDIFNTDWMFHPIRINLAFYTLTPLNGLLSVPLQSAFGLVVANNLLFLSTLVLGAYGAFLLTRSLLSLRKTLVATGQPVSGQLTEHTALSQLFTIDDWIAFVAGLIYGFASSKLFYASLGQFNIASSQWIPFFVLYLLAPPCRRTPVVHRADYGLHAAFLAGIFLIFQTWAELTYATFLVIFALLTFVYALVQLCARAKACAWRRGCLSRVVERASPFRQLGILVAQFVLWACYLPWGCCRFSGPWSRICCVKAIFSRRGVDSPMCLAPTYWAIWYRLAFIPGLGGMVPHFLSPMTRGSRSMSDTLQCFSPCWVHRIGDERQPSSAIRRLVLAVHFSVSGG
jgi:hypothetical protein